MDLLPLIPVIQGANGVITTWSGSNAAQGNSCVVANTHLHGEVVEILQGVSRGTILNQGA